MKVTIVFDNGTRPKEFEIADEATAFLWHVLPFRPAEPTGLSGYCGGDYMGEIPLPQPRPKVKQVRWLIKDRNGRFFLSAEQPTSYTAENIGQCYPGYTAIRPIPETEIEVEQ